VQTIRSLTLEDMEDWYRFRMNGSGGAANYVQIDGDVGNAILSVYKSDGASLVGEVSRQSETTRKVSLTGLPPGVYYVRVWGGGGSTGYNLTIAPAAGVMPDRTPPTAKVTAANVSKGGATIYKFSVIYNDSNLLNTGTVGDGDILVTGPRKYKQVAKLVSKKPSRNAKSINAVYSVPAPGGKWDSNDNGTYVLWMQPKQVADTAGNFVAGKRAKLTSFDVRIPSSTTRSTSRAAVSREVAHTQVFSDTGIQPLLSINSNAYLHRRLPLFDLFAAHPGVDICTCDGDRLACPKRERHSGEVHAE
jgi:hypothetical protein